MNADVVRGVRVLQVALLVGALFLGLAASEARDVTETYGHDRLSVSYEAIVTNASGPWSEGRVITSADAGVPLDAAPEWTITARYETSGVDGVEDTWPVAEARAAKIGGDGRSWWSIVHPIGLVTAGNVATARVNVTALAEEARALDAESSAPGRLELSLTFIHVGKLVISGDAASITRTSSLTFDPDSAYAVVHAMEGGGTYSRVVPRTSDWTPIALATAAILSEPVARVMQKRVPVWGRTRGVHAVAARHVAVPLDAVITTLREAMTFAQHAGGTIIVDEVQGVALVPGKPGVVAALPGRPEVEASLGFRSEGDGFSARTEEIEGVAPPLHSEHPAGRPATAPRDTANAGFTTLQTPDE